jgi:drug/metabolite transporter (DMT)-like permease
MRDVAARLGREGAPVRISIAVVAALCAAFCFALGSLVQQGAARQTHARELRFGLLVALAHQHRWLGGMAATVLAFGIQAAALAFGPLALVQPLVATEVLFALPMIAHRNRLPYTLMAVGVLGGLFGQSAFNAGPLSLSLPVIDTVEPVSSVIVGAAVFGERLARSPGLLALQLTGGAIAAAGIAVLSRSPVTQAEERRESRAAGAQPGRPPAREGNRA